MNTIAARFGIDTRNPNRLVKNAWDVLGGNRFGRYLFGYIIGVVVPYSGNIGASILELNEGYARVAVKERRKIRNHLRSIHAIALANLAEYAANIAFAYSIPSTARFIVTHITAEYLKKARGTIIAECTVGDIPTTEDAEKPLHVMLTDTQNQIVAKFVVYSRIRTGR
jgi:uncharacterized protein (TIGR00369 family)